MASGDDGGDDAWRWARAEQQAARFPAPDDDARRWARAEQRAAGVDVPDEWPALRRFLLVELPIALVVCVVIAVVVSLIWGEWRSWTGSAVSLTALFCLGRSLARAMKYDPDPPNGTMFAVLTSDQRKQNGRQVMGREPVDPEHLNVLRLAARQMRRISLRTIYIFAGLTLLTVGNAITSFHHAWFFAFFVAGLAFALGLLVAAVRQARRTTAFLHRYPEPTSESAASL